MNLRLSRLVDARPEALLEALGDLRGWPRWMDGLREVEPARGGREARLRFGGPRPLELLLEVEPLADGLSFSLVQGDVSEASGAVRVEAEGQGTRVTCELELRFPVAVPSPLLRELELGVLPRWLDRLGAVA